jgi:Glycosyltransferase family 87
MRAGLIILIPVQIVLFLYLAIPQPTAGRDALAYFAAARALDAGASPYTDAINHYLPEAWVAPSTYLYPPTLAALLIPIARLPLPLATTLWFTLISVATLLLIPLLRRLVGWKVAAIGVLGFLPVWQTLCAGQINSVITLFLTLTVLAVQRRQYGRGGGWLAAGALLKLTPAVALVVLAAQRQWRSVIVAIGVGLTTMLATLFIVPLHLWPSGITFAFAHPAVNPTNPWYSSWGALASRLPVPFDTIASITLGGLCLAVLLVRARRIPVLYGVAAAYLLPLLVARTVWDHHAIMALPALAIIWHMGRRGRMLATVTWTTLTLVGGFTMPIMLSICWVACCWPQVLRYRDEASTHQPT